MLLMQRKSSGNLLGFFFSPCLCLHLEFFSSSSALSVSLPFVSCCFFRFSSVCFWFSWNLLFVYRWNCSTFDVIPLRTLRGIRRSKIDRQRDCGRRRIFRCHWNRKRNSPKCIEIIAAIIPKSYGIKEAYSRITVKSNAFSSLFVYLRRFCFYFSLYLFLHSVWVCGMVFFTANTIIPCIIVDSMWVFRFFLLVYCLLRNVHTVDGDHPVGWQTVDLTTWPKNTPIMRTTTKSLHFSKCLNEFNFSQFAYMLCFLESLQD